MKISKILLGVIISASLTTPALASSSGRGTVRFKGSIIAGACSIAPGSSTQTVELGSTNKALLMKGGQTSPCSFSIELEDCDTAIGPSVTITFSGNGNPLNPDLLGINTSTGAAIQLTDGNETPLKLNVKSGDTYKLQNGSNTLLFSTSFVAVGTKGETGDDIDKDTKFTDINEGAFEAVTNFVLAYP